MRIRTLAKIQSLKKLVTKFFMFVLNMIAQLFLIGVKMSLKLILKGKMMLVRLLLSLQQEMEEWI
jgi:hypothetical protein